MGKTRKVSKGNSARFVPNYSHAVETVTESEGCGSSGRVDEESTTSWGSCGRNRESIHLNMDGYDMSNVPFQLLSLSKMSPMERRALKVRLKYELDKVRSLHRKIASFSLDASVHPLTSDVYGYQNGTKRPAMVENLPASTNGMPMTMGKKKNAPGRNGPRTKGGSGSSIRQNESFKQSHPQNTSFVMLMKQCETLLMRLMGHQHAWIFNEPVDVVKHNIPDYFNIIKHPMDLGTVKRKLLSNHYSNPTQFAADVRLTFKNAMTYNPPGHDVHYMAGVMSKYFEARWKAIERKISPTADESTASKSSVIIEHESMYMPPTKKQKTVTMENKVKIERDKPVMTDVERQKLAVELEASLADLPESIINFLQNCTMNSGETSEQEIEIDIDSLSDDTLFTLRKHLDDFLLEKQRKQEIVQPSEIETQKKSGLSKLSSQTCDDSEQADEDVDICGNDPPPPLSSSPPMEIDKDTSQRNDNCYRSSSRESGSSDDTGSDDSSTSETDDVKNSAPASTLDVAVDTKADQKESGLHDCNSGDSINEQDSMSKSSIELNCPQEGESAQPGNQVSPDKQYRAALLRSRFADIIIKAQENSVEKGERPDPEKLKHEKEELERRRREEKARLQAEAKAAEEARKKAEVEAAAEAKRKRELEREAARQALQRMEKTVEINESSQFMEDLNMFRSAPDGQLQHLIEEASPESPQNGLGGFNFQASTNPLEQLGLYMKNDDDEEDGEPESIRDTSDEPNGEGD